MILVTGATGQLGSDVVNELKHRGVDHVGIDIADLDITNAADVNDFFKVLSPASVIHCAAYTSVDSAEDEPDLCMSVNSVGTENIARACQEANAEMIYISTDYVFSGDGILPYEIDSSTFPLSVYGSSKLLGENAVQQRLEKYYIIRISWVFGANGNNFVKTMINHAKVKDELSVVSDQIGSPTFTSDLASLLCDIAFSGKYGIYHATNEGFCSWAEFAEEIMKQIDSPCKIRRISTEQYPTKATRPRNSRLSKSSLDIAGFSRLPEWEDALRRFLSKQ